MKRRKSSRKPRSSSHISPLAELDGRARIGVNTSIEAFARVGRAVIGPDSHIRSQSIIYSGAKIGRGFRTGDGAMIREQTVLGDEVVVGSRCLVLPGARIGHGVTLHSFVVIGEHTRIGDNTWIGPGVIVLNTLHPKARFCRNKPLVDRKGAPVIGKNVRIGGNATINPYVKIGDNSIVGAGSVVVRSVPAGTVVAGNPACEIKRTRDVVCREHPGERVYVSE